jgi:hypothetical protein
MRQDRKRRAKTDKLDARLLRELLMQERLQACRGQGGDAAGRRRIATR